MSPLQALILGVVQGLTEFLPVSSSGHLVVAQELMGLRLPGVTFEVCVHLGTLVAVLFVFREEISQIIDGGRVYPCSGRSSWARSPRGSLVYYSATRWGSCLNAPMWSGGRCWRRGGSFGFPTGGQRPMGS